MRTGKTSSLLNREGTEPGDLQLPLKCESWFLEFHRCNFPVAYHSHVFTDHALRAETDHRILSELYLLPVVMFSKTFCTVPD